MWRISAHRATVLGMEHPEQGLALSWHEAAATRLPDAHHLLLESPPPDALAAGLQRHGAAAVARLDLEFPGN